MTAKRGKLIVVEGGDRSGKSSAIKKVETFISDLIIKRYPNHKDRFPDRSTLIGSLINNFLSSKQDLNDQSIHLLFSSNRWEVVQEIQNLLIGGSNVILDRYSYSGVAYSAAKGLDMEWCKACDAGLVKPDLVVYFDIAPEKAALRGDYGQERYENVQFQEKVQAAFKKLLSAEDNVVYLDADRDMESVQDEFTKIVTECLSSPSLELEYLWK